MGQFTAALETSATFATLAYALLFTGAWLLVRGGNGQRFPGLYGLVLALVCVSWWNLASDLGYTLGLPLEIWSSWRRIVARWLQFWGAVSLVGGLLGIDVRRLWHGRR